jgi:hypothetical protein
MAAAATKKSDQFEILVVLSKQRLDEWMVVRKQLQ